MNPDLSAAIANVLNGLMTVAKSGVNFTQAQLPDVIQQFLILKGIENGVGLFGCLIALGAAAVVGSKAYASFKKGRQWHRDGPAVIGILCIIISVVMTAGIFLALTHILEIIFAPKAYLVGYIADLVRHPSR